MPTQINLPAVLIANMMGITLLFCVAVSSFWSRKMKVGDKKLLMLMFVASVLSCVADPICFIADGEPGRLNHILVHVCNAWLYIGNLVISVSWVFLVAGHLSICLSRVHIASIAILCSAALLLLIVNFFIPVIYSVSEENVYERTGVNVLYYLFHFLFMLDGLILYLYAQHQSGKIKFFPVWAFLIPAAIGGLIQGLFYGVSTITPFITVSISCITSCLQNEYLYKDLLTGLYNRFYLDVLEKKLKVSHTQHTIIMLDINDFKTINDTYGHKTGDQALIEVSKILRYAVGEKGEVIRYAGDEFIVILHTQRKDKTQAVITRINKRLQEIRLGAEHPYGLSVSLGHCMLDLRSNTMDELFDKVDRLMYDGKHVYHGQHKN